MMKKRIKKLFQTTLITGMAFLFMGIASHADYYTNKITLRAGIRGMEVTNLQRDLQRIGYFNAKPTGYFGSLTKNAVMKYQANNGLWRDGIVGPGTSAKIKVHNVIKSAERYFGVPYVWGGTTPRGFDCSGFTKYVFAENRIAMPRTVALQNTVGLWVSKQNLKEGDIVVFSTYKAGPSHVGIYSGEGKFIHASSGAGKIIEVNMYTSYWTPRFIGARRMVA